mmetsp:Transcript_479/g.288  ORF Transcript_479/g.288 Transcript_479/m.288 type:complete len:99 (+) Transcript_479:540-836(+)
MLGVWKIVGLVQRTTENAGRRIKSELLVYVWEIGDGKILHSLQIDINPKRARQFTNLWKRRTLIDLRNNFAFIPEFSPKKKGDLYSKIYLNNEVSGDY